MTRVKDIMTREVISVSPTLSIRDAMSLLSSRHISGVPVVVGTEVVGVVTSNDLMALAAELPGESGERRDQVELDAPAPRDEDYSGLEMEPPGAFFTDLWEDAGTDVAMRFAGATGTDWTGSNRTQAQGKQGRTSASMDKGRRKSNRGRSFTVRIAAEV